MSMSVSGAGHGLTLVYRPVQDLGVGAVLERGGLGEELLGSALALREVEEVVAHRGQQEEVCVDHLGGGKSEEQRQQMMLSADFVVVVRLVAQLWMAVRHVDLCTSPQYQNVPRGS